MFTSHTRTFLSQLAKHNHREWFQDHKVEYERSHEEAIAFAEALMGLMQQHDLLEPASGKKSLQRIYCDTRFSKDKTPYKDHWGGGYRRATAERRGGYYFHVMPGGTFLGGGFWGPNKDDLQLIRDHLAADATPLREALGSDDFSKTYGPLLGEQLKTAPKGFDKDHPDIDLLRYKQFIVRHEVPDSIAFSPDFPTYANEVFQKIRPFFDVMSEYLTTDLNGISLLEK